jgi:hypothetical protein
MALISFLIAATNLLLSERLTANRYHQIIQLLSIANEVILYDVLIIVCIGLHAHCIVTRTLIFR